MTITYNLLLTTGLAPEPLSAKQSHSLTLVRRPLFGAQTLLVM